jgi:hypothetical protein
MFLRFFNPLSSLFTPNSSSLNTVSNQDIFENAKLGQGVILGVCANAQSSGCYDFAKTLHDQFPKLDYVKIAGSSNCTCIHCNPKSKVLGSISSIASSWKFAIMTGCNVKGCLNDLLSLAADPRFQALQEVYYVMPPHHSPGFGANLDFIERTYAQSPYRISVLAADLNIDKGHHIGIPLPCPDLPISDFKLPEHCYGLMYNFMAESFNFTKSYLEAYFASIAMISPAKRKSVMAISLTSQSTLITSVAAQFGISVIFNKRLPQNHFIKALQILSIKKGLLSCDGVQTLLQACFYKTPFMFYHHPVHDVNRSFILSIMSKVPSKYQAYAGVMLGVNSSSSGFTADQSVISETQKTIHAILKKSMNFFVEKASLAQYEPPIVNGAHVIINYNITLTLGYVESLQSVLGVYQGQSLVQRFMSNTRITLPLSWLKQVKAFNSPAIDELEKNLNLDSNILRRLV